MIGTMVGNYRVEEFLGQGGMGAVYRAVDVMLERDVALKFLRPELASHPDLAERFRTEAVALAKLSHPNIAAVYGLHRVDDQLVMALEYVEGQTLEARLRGEGRLRLTDALGIIGAVLDGLDYAHARGIVHRDVKSANVMLRTEGVVKVMDFGIARMMGSSRQTRTGFIVGTLLYMSPEQITGGDVDGRADIYAAGILLYEMLTGRVPFEADSQWAIMQAHLEQPPEPPSRIVDLPGAVESAILRALAKSRDDRPRTAAELKALLTDASRASSASMAASDPVGDVSRFDPGPPALVNGVAEGPDRAALGRSGVREADSHEAAAVAGAAKSEPPRRPGRLVGRRWQMAGAAALVVSITMGVWWARAPGGPDLRGADTVTTPAGVPPADDPSGAEMRRPADPRAAELGPPALWVDPPDSAQAVDRAGSGVSADRPPSATAPHPPAAPSARVVAPGTGAPASATPPGALPDTTTRVDRPAAQSRPGARSMSEVTFDRVKWLERAEDGKAREIDALLRLGPDSLEVLAVNTRTPLQTIPYATIAAATYSQSRHPRWKEGAGAAVLVGVFAAPVFFMKSTRHWLAIQTPDDFAVLRLDKNNHHLILPALEVRSGTSVDREP